MARKKKVGGRPRVSVGALMGKAHLAFNEVLTRRLHAAGFDDVRLASAAVFRGIDRKGTRISVLAERAAVTKQTMGQLVRELEEGGYLELVPDPDDGRAKLAMLTRHGFDLAAAVGRAARSLEQELARKIGKARVEGLRSSLEQVLDELGPRYRTDWYQDD